MLAHRCIFFGRIILWAVEAGSVVSTGTIATAAAMSVLLAVMTSSARGDGGGGTFGGPDFGSRVVVRHVSKSKRTELYFT